MSVEQRVKDADFLAGGGEMAERLRTFDGSGSPLGPVTGWSQGLKTATSICLQSRFPIVIFWGRDLALVYNDAYGTILGPAKHPLALGRPGAVIWAEIWEIISPMLAGVLERGVATWSDDQLLVIERDGVLGEGYFTFSYSPIREESGAVGGVFCAVMETTNRVIGERQLELLRELGVRNVDARSWQEACAQSAQALRVNPRDLPFALLYVAEPDGSAFSLAGESGIEPDHPAAAADRWPLASVLGGREVVVVDSGRASDSPLPAGAWDEPPTRVALVPVAAAGETARGGVLAVGLNPFRRLDGAYMDFLMLVGGQISASLANAQAYEEERRRAEALAELDRAKTAFFSNVSHEFRTPLTLILGPVEELLAENADDRLQVVQRNSLRLLRLVNTMLDFSRIEAGRIAANYEPVDLSAYTGELASVFRAAVEAAGLRLIVDCPPLSEPVFVDREMWEKIVLNLLSNAFKFTLDGEVEVRLEPLDGHACLTIRDTGVGIPAEDLPRVFDRFHRAENTRGRTHEGTGIGLALVQELAQLHGGEVAVESVVDEGSSFTVTIPFGTAHLDPERVAPALELSSTATSAEAYTKEALRWLADNSAAEPAPAEISAPATSYRAGSFPLRPARVLWADDNADMRDYVARLLGDDFEVEAVADGAAALAAAQREPPDLVLADVMMPRLDGIELMRELRSDPDLAAVPIILLSARAGEEAQVEGMQAGADDYLIKPFSAYELVARVESHVRLARLRQDFVARQRFRGELAVALRPLADPVEIKDAASRLLGQHLGASRTYYAEVEPDGDQVLIERDYVDGAASIAGRHRISDFGPGYGEEWRAARKVVLADTHAGSAQTDAEQAAFDAVGVRSFVALPLVKDGRLVSVLGATQSEPRQWTDSELALIEETAEHTWAALELARAKRERNDLLKRESAARLDAERRAHAATAFTFVSIGVALTDSSGVVQSWNVAAEEITGVPAETIIGQQLETTVSGWAAVADRIPMGATGAQRPPPAISLPFQAGERELWLSISATSFDGGTVYTFADVSDERELERMRSDIIATVSHELRTPLAAVYGAAATLQREDLDLDSSGRRQFLEMIETQSRRLTTIIEEILLASQLDSGEVTLSPVKSDPLQIAREVVESARTASPGAEITLVEPPHPIPLADVDADKVQQVLRNLVENAVRYSNETPQIEVRVQNIDRNLRFSVVDCGVGIAPEAQGRVFEKFYRIDSDMSSGVGGTGLGLYISRELARRMNGKLRLESKPGHGSSFTLEIPTEPM